MPCKLLKISDVQLSPRGSRKFFTLFSQNCMTEIHTGMRHSSSLNVAVRRFVHSRLPSLDNEPFETRGLVLGDIITESVG